MKVAVVGGGVIGLSSALVLARAGHAATVFEPDASLSAPSWNNAGHLAVEQRAPLASIASIRSVGRRHFRRGGALDLPLAHARTWVPFATRLVAAARPARFRAGTAALGGLLTEALPAWRRLTSSIGEAGLLREDGHLMVWGSPAAAATGRAAWMRAETGGASLVPCRDEDLALLRQVLGNEAAGCARFDGTGAIADLGALHRALRRALAAAGGTIVAERASVVRADGRAGIAGHEADAVLVAAGVGSGTVMQGLGIRAPIVAERGYHLRAAADRWPADAPPIVFEDRSMIVTRYRDTVQAASFVEVAAPDAPPDPRKWERLERHVRELGLPMEAPFTRWMGSRPTFPDYLPAIGRATSMPNLFYAFGHQHLGLTLAAVTAEAVAALVDGAASAVDLSPFDLARFAPRKARP
ncbi:NAD(P)/FAD-dependent oxidoreductase [Sphingomonas adhaesiva]|uniref:NAD(P)/FAD-dependent oxidoreductase n=1 Tax=Sphingomonas adhaesiva TaxID=28212 RepID=UPI002FFC10C5